ncbi:MAG: cvpA family protein [Dehalococcoidia bacterium]|nr:cvpA family protein [Dehalococcoidia bacterium]
MNWLDIVIIIILAISAVGGWKTGLIQAGLGWLGIVVGIVLAGDYYQAMAKPLSGIFQNDLASVLSFTVILAAVILLSYLIGLWLNKVVTVTLLGWVNRLMGAAFGLLTGAMVIGALIALWIKFVGTPGTVGQSAIAPLLLDRFPLVLALLPDEFEPVRSFFRR